MPSGGDAEGLSGDPLRGGLKLFAGVAGQSTVVVEAQGVSGVAGNPTVGLAQGVSGVAADPTVELVQGVAGHPTLLKPQGVSAKSTDVESKAVSAKCTKNDACPEQYASESSGDSTSKGPKKRISPKRSTPDTCTHDDGDTCQASTKRRNLNPSILHKESLESEDFSSNSMLDLEPDEMFNKLYTDVKELNQNLVLNFGTHEVVQGILTQKPRFEVVAEAPRDSFRVLNKLRSLSRGVKNTEAQLAQREVRLDQREARLAKREVRADQRDIRSDKKEVTLEERKRQLDKMWERYRVYTSGLSAGNWNSAAPAAGTWNPAAAWSNAAAAGTWNPAAAWSNAAAAGASSNAAAAAGASSNAAPAGASSNDALNKIKDGAAGLSFNKVVDAFGKAEKIVDIADKVMKIPEGAEKMSGSAKDNYSKLQAFLAMLGTAAIALANQAFRDIARGRGDDSFGGGGGGDDSSAGGDGGGGDNSSAGGDGGGGDNSSAGGGGGGGGGDSSGGCGGGGGGGDSSGGGGGGDGDSSGGGGGDSGGDDDGDD